MKYKKGDKVRVVANPLKSSAVAFRMGQTGIIAYVGIGDTLYSVIFETPGNYSGQVGGFFTNEIILCEKQLLFKWVK